MKTINVEGLPEPVAQAVAEMVAALREQLQSKQDTRRRVELPVWPGKVIGPLTRDKIYEDVD